jgi:hypothetical protein
VVRRRAWSGRRGRGKRKKMGSCWKEIEDYYIYIYKYQ